MTQLEIINRIMIRLREPTVTSSTETEYSRLISELVVGAHEQILDEHDWRAQLVTIRFNLELNRVIYPIDLPINAELQFDMYNNPMARVYDDAGDITLPEEEDVNLPGILDLDGELCDCDTFTLVNDGERLFAAFMGEPDAVEEVEMVFWAEPTPLRSDGTTDGTTIRIPDRPIFALALMYAYNERGEEIGEPGNLAERRYMQALQAAIEKELRPLDHANEFDWRRD